MTDHLATVPTEPKAYRTSRAGTAQKSVTRKQARTPARRTIH
jgi:hypothetical protein